MRELPSALKKIPPLVLSVKLAGSDRFTDSAKETFLSLVKDQDLELTAVGKEGDLQICILSSPSGSILNLMCDRLARTAYREENLQTGQKQMVQICSLKPAVKSSWSLFVQVVDNRLKMEVMQNKVNQKVLPKLN